MPTVLSYLLWIQLTLYVFTSATYVYLHKQYINYVRVFSMFTPLSLHYVYPLAIFSFNTILLGIYVDTSSFAKPQFNYPSSYWETVRLFTFFSLLAIMLHEHASVTGLPVAHAWDFSLALAGELLGRKIFTFSTRYYQTAFQMVTLINTSMTMCKSFSFPTCWHKFTPWYYQAYYIFPLIGVESILLMF